VTFALFFVSGIAFIAQLKEHRTRRRWEKQRELLSKMPTNRSSHQCRISVSMHCRLVQEKRSIISCFFWVCNEV
jgi:hypothetical protein